MSLAVLTAAPPKDTVEYRVLVIPNIINPILIKSRALIAPNIINTALYEKNIVCRNTNVGGQKIKEKSNSETYNLASL